MATINFSSLKLKTPSDVKTFDFMGKKIEVAAYLPVEQKLDIIAITMQKSEENGIYNRILLDTFFHLNLIYSYTNIVFTDKQRKDELKLFDLFDTNGFFDVFLPLIEDDYNELRSYLDEMTNDTRKYTNTAASVVRGLIEDLPENANAAKMIVDSFDPERYQNVLSFAKAANGGRPILGVIDVNPSGA